MSTALSPEERDQFLAQLRERTATDGFHFLSTEHLQELNEIESDGDPILSLFMELTPETRVGDAWQITFKDLAKQALQKADDMGVRKQVEGELARIEGAFRAGLPRTGRGLAVYTCSGMNLMRQLGTPVSVENQVYVDRRPYVRPLVRVRDEHDRFAIALVSMRRIRVFFSQIGLVEEVFDDETDEIGLTDFASKDQRQDIRAEQKKSQAKRAAQVVELMTKQLGVRHVIYSIAADMEADFLDAMNQATRERVAASFGCDTNASPAEVSDKAADVQREVEAREETETIGKVQELLTTRSVVGIDDVLDMLNQQRVMTLILDDEVRVPGGIDAESGMLTTQTSGTYEATGGTITPQDDLFEHMLERALEQGASLELVRSEKAKEALQKHGPAAAILRF